MPWFRFIVPRFHIESLRSAHNDTLYATVALTSYNAQGGLHSSFPATTWPLGDHQGKQTVPLTLPVDAIEVLPPDAQHSDGGWVNWVFTLYNTGHKDSGWVTAVNDAASALAGTASAAAIAKPGQNLVSGPGQLSAVAAGVVAVQVVLSLLTANCDGPVGALSRSFTCKELIEKCVPMRQWQWVEGNPGTNSPAGCGDNSKYDIAYLIEQVPAPPVLKH